MKLRKTLTSLMLCAVMTVSLTVSAFADSAKVVTLGANLSEQQKETMLKYFGVKKNEVVLLEVNNAEERKYLEGIATESQLGTRTFSCAYVEPTKAKSGINVKTANITWVTSSMVATTLLTAGVTDANAVIASPFPVSGTGALTGIMKAFEDATGEKLDEEKKEIASEELIITGDLGSDIGQDKATGIINDIKIDVIKNNTKDTTQIAETIVNVTNNYNITLSSEQQKQIEDLMVKIANQDYNYNAMKKTLKSVGKTVEENLKALGESIDKGFFESIGNWFSNLGEKISGLFEKKEDLGILEETNDSLLGEDAKIDATDKEAIKLPTAEEAKGFFSKIWDFIKGIFGGNKEEAVTPNENIENNSEGQGVENANNNAENIDTSQTTQPEENSENTTNVQANETLETNSNN